MIRLSLIHAPAAGSCRTIPTSIRKRRRPRWYRSAQPAPLADGPHYQSRRFAGSRQWERPPPQGPGKAYGAVTRHCAGRAHGREEEKKNGCQGHWDRRRATYGIFRRLRRRARRCDAAAEAQNARSRLDLFLPRGYTWNLNGAVRPPEGGLNPFSGPPACSRNSAASRQVFSGADGRTRGATLGDPQQRAVFGALNHIVYVMGDFWVSGCLSYSHAGVPGSKQLNARLT